MNIDEINGGTAMAMLGKNCFTIASDLRLGEQFQNISDDKSKVYKMGDRLYMGIAGLATDAQTIVEKISFRKNLYELRENRAIRPKTFCRMLSSMLYERRFGPFFSEPVIAGLDPKTNAAYLCEMDLLGCLCEPKDFSVSGTSSTIMAGACESFWEPEMDADALFLATSQSFLSALERDAISGAGVIVYTVTPEKVVVKSLKPRLD